MDVTQNQDFYRWLKERESKRSQIHEQPRVQLDIPFPPQTRTHEETPEDNRGVTVIEFF